MTAQAQKRDDRLEIESSSPKRKSWSPIKAGKKWSPPAVAAARSAASLKPEAEVKKPDKVQKAVKVKKAVKDKKTILWQARHASVRAEFLKNPLLMQPRTMDILRALPLPESAGASWERRFLSLASFLYMLNNVARFCYRSV